MLFLYCYFKYLMLFYNIFLFILIYTLSYYKHYKLLYIIWL